MIYIDLDGVLADNKTPFRNFTGLSDAEFTTENYWKCVNDYQVDGKRWFIDLPKMPDSDVLLAYIQLHGLGYKILTATGYEYIDVSHQKRLWCLRELKLPRHYVMTSPNSEGKAAYAHPQDILIDDSERSINSWLKFGGIGILHKDANSTIEQLRIILGLS